MIIWYELIFYCFEKYVCYMVGIIPLTLVNLTCIIFWYENSIVGLLCVKNNVGIFIFQNIYHKIFQEVENLCRGQLLIILNHHQLFVQDVIYMFWIHAMSPLLSLITFSNATKWLISIFFSNSSFCNWFSLVTFASLY